MAIEINPRTTVKATEEGLKPVEPGVATPKMDTPADYDAVLAAARKMMERNTGSSEEEERVAKPKEEAAPKLPEGKSEGEFLLEQAAKSGGAPKKRAEKAAEFKLGPLGEQHDSLVNSVDRYAKAWNKIKSSFSGLVVKDENEQDVDAAGHLHKHVDNIISQAQRHLETAAQKEMRGYVARNESPSERMRTASPINVARQVFPNRSGQTKEFDDLTRFAPLSTGPGEDLPPSEHESLKFLETYANNDFVQKSIDADAMSPADHVNHARNLLASLTVAIPQLADTIHSDEKLKAQMAKSGKVGFTGEQARKLLNPSLVDVHNKTEEYTAQSGSPVAERAKTVHDAFGLDHHLKRLTALANSEETQRSNEQRISIIHNAYYRKYGALLAKRKGLRPDHSQEVVLSALPGHKFEPAGRAFPNQYTQVPARTIGPSVFKATEDGTVYSRERFREAFSGASEDTVNRLYTASLNGRDANGVSKDELELQAKREHLVTRGNSLAELAGSHPKAATWQGLINSAYKTAGVNPKDAAFVVDSKGTTQSAHSAIDNAHSLLDRIQTSMQKHGLAPLNTATIIRPRSETDPIPTLSEYARLAKMGSPIRQSESFLKTGEHEPEVDPTMGGLKDADAPMTLKNPFGYTGSPAGSRVTAEVVTSPSASGFNVPSDKAVSDFAAGKRERRRRALTEAAERASKASDRMFDPWLTGGVKPISMNDVLPTDATTPRTPEVLGRNEVVKQRKKKSAAPAAENTPASSAPPSAAPDGQSSEERAASLFNPGTRPRGR